MFVRDILIVNIVDEIQYNGKIAIQFVSSFEMIMLVEGVMNIIGIGDQSCVGYVAIPIVLKVYVSRKNLLTE